MRCPGITYCGKFYAEILPHRLFSRLQERIDAPGQVTAGRKIRFQLVFRSICGKIKRKIATAASHAETPDKSVFLRSKVW